MPYSVEVRCPACSGLASFEYSEVVKIRLRKDIPFFQESKYFDYQQRVDSCGHAWHAALFFHGLHLKDPGALKGLPEGYQPSDWSHSQYLMQRRRSEFGTLQCGRCNARKRHQIKWPADAWHQVSVKDRVLWAFHRESAMALRDYIASSKRDPKLHPWISFLLHIPQEFLASGVRSRVVKGLQRLLDVGAPTSSQ